MSSPSHSGSPSTVEPPIDKVLPGLDAVRRSSPGQWSAKCPAHFDKKASLSVCEQPDGKVLVKCHAGCTTEDIIKALGLQMSDLFPSQSRLPSRRRTSSSLGKPVAAYLYKDEGGNNVLKVVRYEPKDFRVEHWDGTGWRRGMGGKAPLLYNLPKLRGHARFWGGKTPPDPVFFVEGEKDVHTLSLHCAIIATSMLGGASRPWLSEYGDALRPFRVVVVPDNDEPGRQHAKKVANALLGVAAEVRVLELPGLQPGGDVSDWIGNPTTHEEQLGRREELLRLAEAAPLWAESEEQLPEIPPVRSRFQLLDDADIEAMPPLEWLVDGIIPKAGSAELHAPPAVGKTFVAVDLSLHIATGRDWHGRRVKHGPVVYVAAEGLSGFQRRISAWKQYHKVSGPTGAKWVTEAVQLLDENAVDEIISAISQMPTPPVLVVLDTLARCFLGGDENSARDMGTAVAAADRIRRQTGAAVLIIHHTLKNGGAERGSSALRAAQDAMLGLKRQGSTLALTCEKMKDGPEFCDIPLGLLPCFGSCVVTSADVAAVATVNVLTPKEREALAALRNVAGTEGAGYEKWRKASGIPNSTFARIRHALVDKQFVKRITDAGRESYALTDYGEHVFAPDSQAPTVGVGMEKHQLTFSHTAPFRGREREGGPEESESAAVAAAEDLEEILAID